MPDPLDSVLGSRIVQGHTAIYSRTPEGGPRRAGENVQFSLRFKDGLEGTLVVE